MTLFDVEIVTISDDLHYWPAILNFYPLLKILNFAKYDGRALFCYLYWPLTKCLEIHLSAAVLLYSCNLIKKKCSVSPCHLLAFKRFNRSKKKYMGKSLVFKDPVLIFHEKKHRAVFRAYSDKCQKLTLVNHSCGVSAYLFSITITRLARLCRLVSLCCTDLLSRTTLFSSKAVWFVWDSNDLSTAIFAIMFPKLSMRSSSLVNLWYI